MPTAFDNNKIEIVESNNFYSGIIENFTNKFILEVENINKICVELIQSQPGFFQNIKESIKTKAGISLASELAQSLTTSIGKLAGEKEMAAAAAPSIGLLIKAAGMIYCRIKGKKDHEKLQAAKKFSKRLEKLGGATFLSEFANKIVHRLFLAFKAFHHNNGQDDVKKLASFLAATFISILYEKKKEDILSEKVDHVEVLFSSIVSKEFRDTIFKIKERKFTSLHSFTYRRLLRKAPMITQEGDFFVLVNEKGKDCIIYPPQIVSLEIVKKQGYQSAHPLLNAKRKSSNDFESRTADEIKIEIKKSIESLWLLDFAKKRFETIIKSPIKMLSEKYDIIIAINNFHKQDKKFDKKLIAKLIDYALVFAHHCYISYVKETTENQYIKLINPELNFIVKELSWISLQIETAIADVQLNSIQRGSLKLLKDLLKDESAYLAVMHDLNNKELQRYKELIEKILLDITHIKAGISLLYESDLNKINEIEKKFEAIKFGLDHKGKEALSAELAKQIETLKSNFSQALQNWHFKTLTTPSDILKTESKNPSLKTIKPLEKQLNAQPLQSVEAIVENLQMQILNAIQTRDNPQIMREIKKIESSNQAAYLHLALNTPDKNSKFLLEYVLEYYSFPSAEKEMTEIIDFFIAKGADPIYPSYRIIYSDDNPQNLDRHTIKKRLKREVVPNAFTSKQQKIEFISIPTVFHGKLENGERIEFFKHINDLENDALYESIDIDFDALCELKKDKEDREFLSEEICHAIACNLFKREDVGGISDLEYSKQEYVFESYIRTIEEHTIPIGWKTLALYAKTKKLTIAIWEEKNRKNTENEIILRYPKDNKNTISTTKKNSVMESVIETINPTATQLHFLIVDDRCVTPLGRLKPLSTSRNKIKIPFEKTILWFTQNYLFRNSKSVFQSIEPENVKIEKNKEIVFFPSIKDKKQKSIEPRTIDLSKLENSLFSYANIHSETILHFALLFNQEELIKSLLVTLGAVFRSTITIDFYEKLDESAKNIIKALNRQMFNYAMIICNEENFYSSYKNNLDLFENFKSRYVFLYSLKFPIGKNQQTPLFFMSENSTFKGLRYLADFFYLILKNNDLKSLEFLSHLIREPFSIHNDIDQPNILGLTPITLASYKNNLKALRLYKLIIAHYFARVEFGTKIYLDEFEEEISEEKFLILLDKIIADVDVKTANPQAAPLGNDFREKLRAEILIAFSSFDQLNYFALHYGVLGNATLAVDYLCNHCYVDIFSTVYTERAFIEESLRSEYFSFTLNNDVLDNNWLFFHNDKKNSSTFSIDDEKKQRGYTALEFAQMKKNKEIEKIIETALVKWEKYAAESFIDTVNAKERLYRAEELEKLGKEKKYKNKQTKKTAYSVLYAYRREKNIEEPNDIFYYDDAHEACLQRIGSMTTNDLLKYLKKPFSEKIFFHKTSLIEFKNKAGINALLMAVKLKRYDLMAILLEYGCNLHDSKSKIKYEKILVKRNIVHPRVFQLAHKNISKMPPEEEPEFKKEPVVIPANFSAMLCARKDTVALDLLKQSKSKSKEEIHKLFSTLRKLENLILSINKDQLRSIDSIANQIDSIFSPLSGNDYKTYSYFIHYTSDTLLHLLVKIIVYMEIKDIKKNDQKTFENIKEKLLQIAAKTTVSNAKNLFRKNLANESILQEVPNDRDISKDIEFFTLPYKAITQEFVVQIALQTFIALSNTHRASLANLACVLAYNIDIHMFNNYVKKYDVSILLMFARFGDNYWGAFDVLLARSANLSKLEKLALVTPNDTQSLSLLHLLCCWTHIQSERLRYVLAYGADPNVKTTRISYIKLILDENNHWNIDSEPDESKGEVKKTTQKIRGQKTLELPAGTTPAMLAAITNNKTAIALFIDTLDLDAKNEKDKGVIFYSIFYNSCNVFSELISKPGFIGCYFQTLQDHFEELTKLPQNETFKRIVINKLLSNPILLKEALFYAVDFNDKQFIEDIWLGIDSLRFFFKLQITDFKPKNTKSNWNTNYSIMQKIIFEKIKYELNPFLQEDFQSLSDLSSKIDKEIESKSGYVFNEQEFFDDHIDLIKEGNYEFIKNNETGNNIFHYLKTYSSVLNSVEKIIASNPKEQNDFMTRNEKGFSPLHMCILLQPTKLKHPNFIKNMIALLNSHPKFDDTMKNELLVYALMRANEHFITILLDIGVKPSAIAIIIASIPLIKKEKNEKKEYERLSDAMKAHLMANFTMNVSIQLESTEVKNPDSEKTSLDKRIKPQYNSPIFFAQDLINSAEKRVDANNQLQIAFPDKRVAEKLLEHLNAIEGMNNKSEWKIIELITTPKKYAIEFTEKEYNAIMQDSHAFSNIDNSNQTSHVSRLRHP